MNKKGSSQYQSQEQSQINVYVRIKPQKNEHMRKTLKVIDKGVALNYRDKIHQLYFDGILDQTYPQEKVFNSSCLPLVEDVLRGNNASLFVYGQTGTGKTFTMGTLETIKREDQGLIPLSLNHIINTLNKTKSKDEWNLSLSFMQIYMEDIYDLLNPTNGKLQIRQDLQFGETYVEDLVIVPIENYKQSIDLINAGLKYRKIGNQKMNEKSSRSHTIFTIYVTQKVSPTQYMSSTLTLIDLAGSERIKRSNSVDVRLDEAKFINTSLSALGNVISALSQNNADKFIPYRSSKLTRILKNSLTGRSKISVICTTESSQENIYQTYSTLIFADRCKEIRFPNQPVINIESFDQFQDKDLRAAFQKSLQKEKEYLEIIKNMEHGGSRVSKDSHRDGQFALIIESIYKLFGQINSHLKKVLDPQIKTETKPPHPKVTVSTPVPTIKQHLTFYAKETIEHINSLSGLAFGQGKISTNTPAHKTQTQTLTSLLLESMRQNIKLYQNILIKEDKESVERQICLQEYEKEKKQQILNKLKVKKLKNLQNNFEQIWSENHTSPLTNLLNNIRRGNIGVYAQKTTSIKTESDKDLSNPKQILKMLTRKESQRKHKEMLIDDEVDESRDEKEETPAKKENGSVGSSNITYFQKKTSPSGAKSSHKQTSEKKEERVDSSGYQIKKLLDSLIASKMEFEEKVKSNREQ